MSWGAEILIQEFERLEEEKKKYPRYFPWVSEVSFAVYPGFSEEESRRIRKYANDIIFESRNSTDYPDLVHRYPSTIENHAVLISFHNTDQDAAFFKEDVLTFLKDPTVLLLGVTNIRASFDCLIKPEAGMNFADLAASLKNVESVEQILQAVQAAGLFCRHYPSMEEGGPEDPEVIEKKKHDYYRFLFEVPDEDNPDDEERRILRKINFYSLRLQKYYSEKEPYVVVENFPNAYELLNSEDWEYLKQHPEVNERIDGFYYSDLDKVTPTSPEDHLAHANGKRKRFLGELAYPDYPKTAKIFLAHDACEEYLKYLIAKYSITGNEAESLWKAAILHTYALRSLTEYMSNHMKDTGADKLEKKIALMDTYPCAFQLMSKDPTLTDGDIEYCKKAIEIVRKYVKDYDRKHMEQ